MEIKNLQAKSDVAKAIAARECDTFGEDSSDYSPHEKVELIGGLRIHATPKVLSGGHEVEYSGEVFPIIPRNPVGFGLPLVPSNTQREELYDRANRE